MKVFENIPELCASFTDSIFRLLKNKEKITVSLSGGSTPKEIFDYWAAHDVLPWRRILFYWGDERCVSPDDEMSNYGMTKKHLFDKINIPEKNIFRIYGENNPEEEAIRYSKILPDSFDLVILGIGDDGHTASIFPNNINMWDSNEKCIVAAHPESGMQRISITGKVINNSKFVAFLVTGKNKATKIKEIKENREKYVDLYPAARVNPQTGKLCWFIDAPAASLLNK